MRSSQHWEVFIHSLREYIEEHHHCPNKHTSLLNQTKYYRKKQRTGKITDEQSQELDSVLAMRDLEEHTGGRKKNNTRN